MWISPQAQTATNENKPNGLPKRPQNRGFAAEQRNRMNRTNFRFTQLYPRARLWWLHLNFQWQFVKQHFIKGRRDVVVVLVCTRTIVKPQYVVVWLFSVSLVQLCFDLFLIYYWFVFGFHWKMQLRNRVAATQSCLCCLNCWVIRYAKKNVFSYFGFCFFLSSSFFLLLARSRDVREQYEIHTRSCGVTIKVN